MAKNLEMKRKELLNSMRVKALAISGANADKWNRDAENEIWTMASDWNGIHPELEIFMCEHGNDNDEVDGFYIEDDYYITDIEEHERRLKGI